MSLKTRFLYVVMATVVSVATHGPDRRAEVGMGLHLHGVCTHL